MDRKTEFASILSDLKEAGKSHSTLGDRILTDLWTIYSKGLYKTEDFNGVIYDSFRSMCEEEVAPSFEDPDYFYDFSNIVDRIFSYLQRRLADGDPIYHPKEEDTVITPEWCMAQKRWLGKLISISQSIESCKSDEEIESLFHVAITGTREDTKRKGESIRESHVPVKISMVQIFNGDGSYTLTTESISIEQVNMVLHKLGAIIDLHMD